MRPQLEEETETAAAGAAGAGFATLLAVLLLFMTLYYLSMKGMCRFTEGDGPIMFFLKSIANMFTFGILSIIMFFVRGKDCATRQVNNRPKGTASGVVNNRPPFRAGKTSGVKA